MEDINSIKEQLKSDNAEVRRVAVEKIAEHLSKESLDILFESIGDRDWRVRKTAADSLLYFHSIDTFYSSIFRALESDENAGKRNAAVEIITKLGDKAVNEIVNFLSKANFEVKKLLIDALGEIKNETSTEKIVGFLNDDDGNVRAAAAETLGKIKDKRYAGDLVKVLDKDDMQLQFCALEALVKIGAPVDIDMIIPLVKKKILRKAAFDVIGTSKDKKAIDYLIEGVNDTSKACRESAIKGIVNIYSSMSDDMSKEEIISRLNSVSSEELLALLTGSLLSTHFDVRIAVITILGFLKAISHIPDILDTHGDENELKDYKFNAILNMGKDSYEIIKEEFQNRRDQDKVFLAQTMGALKDNRYQPLLTESLSSNFGHLRSEASLALALLAGAESIKDIFPYLNDQYKDVQAAALDALTTLGKLHPKEIREEIEANLIANDDQFKISIISLIGRIGIKEDIKHLDMALRYGNPEVRTAAVYAIGAINILEESKHLILALTDESDKVRIATAKTLGLLYSGDSVKALVRALDDENTWVRINAMRSLARLNATNTVDDIKEFLKHQNPLLVINAIESLNDLNAPELKSYLSELLHHEDTEVVKMAISTLKKSTDKDYIDDILALLKSSAPDIRLLVYKSLEEVKDDESVIDRVKPFIEEEKDDMIKQMACRILGI